MERVVGQARLVRTKASGRCQSWTGGMGIDGVGLGAGLHRLDEAFGGLGYSLVLVKRTGSQSTDRLLVSRLHPLDLEERGLAWKEA